MKPIKMMAILSVAVLSIVSCSKSSSPNPAAPQGTAFVSVVNASPGTSSYNVYSDGTNINPSGTIAYGGNTGVVGGSPYEMITSGSHAIKLSSNGTTFPVDSTFNFTANGYYSVYAYDTANSSGSLRTLILNDNLTPPTNGDAEVRFLNLSPNSQNLNVAIQNTDSTAHDSLMLNNISYVGTTTTSVDSLANFTFIAPGTYKVLLNSGAIENQPPLFANNSVTFAAGKIYTIYAKGYVNGVNGADSLGLGVIENY